ncbi:MAG: ABC transporter ATP-binding protein [Bacteroidetes bacterium]|nr:ABC transporter ATP-binding protein [Bacteroidota bacterium]MDA0880255.1 ABC transporter ATP-binding protein [Bacteroidota bacterium]MDA1116011.1 ABC transporter ATP-binding protein [Bacteroidota bacterium]
MTDSKTQSFDFHLYKRLMQFIRPYRWVFVGSFLAVIGLSVFGAAKPYLTQIIVDEFIGKKISEGFLKLTWVLVALLVLEVFTNLLFIYWANWLGQTVVRDIRVKLYQHMLNFKMAYFDKSSVGVLITRAVTDMERIADIFSEGLFMIFSDVLKMLVVAGVMCYMNWKLSLIVFCTFPIIVYATKVFQKYMKRAFDDVRTEVANLNSFVQERVTGMKTLQLFTRESIEFDNFKTINQRHKKGWLKTVWYNSIFFPIAEIISSITLGFVVWFGGLNMIDQNTVTLGEVTAFVMMIPMMFRPLNQIANKFNTLQMGMVASSRVFKVLDTEAQIDKSGELLAPHFKGDIQFKDVHFSYLADEPVLNGLNLDIKAGETIAIVGATGAGKSTIINLFNRFYDIDQGEILIDGNNVKMFTLGSLRGQIAIVLQDVFLFADTIFNNITLRDPSISLEQVRTAAQEIGIDQFIESLPGGYQFNVKERGAMLSSGQKQLLSFLRAYVTNPSILILDEATSSVDMHAEKLIQTATDKMTKNRTSIVIAHRLATVQKADRIIVMDKGCIVEQGSHEELLKNDEGYYKHLYEVQFLQTQAV